MAQQTRLFRRQILRSPREQYAWCRVRRSQVRRVLQALEALLRRT
jgi:hypothetical protein